MKTPFRLDAHPRRPQPLAPPPDAYFDRLPMRVMQRVQGPGASERPVFGWLARLAAPVRTALATSVVLGGFAGAFLLSQSTSQPTTLASSERVLAGVPQSEMVQYLLAGEQRVTLTDLAELPATSQALPETYLQASPDELQEALDAQPADEIYL